jgi:hypothetical protein
MEVVDNYEIHGPAGTMTRAQRSKLQSPSAGLATTKRLRGKRSGIPPALDKQVDLVVPFVNDQVVGHRSSRGVVTKPAPVVDPPPLVTNHLTKRSLKYKSQGRAPAPAPSIRVKEQLKRVEAQLIENFIEEHDNEAKAKEESTKTEIEIVKKIVKQPETTSANVDVDEANKRTLNHIVKEVTTKINRDRREQSATRVAEGISAQIQDLSSIPVFQDYIPGQIQDFVLKIFPDDAISVLDNFEKLSPEDKKEIVDFVILKCKGVTLNVSVDDAGPADIA